MTKPLILAVDDAHELLVLMSRALAADYEVKTAESGAAASKK
jgi:response regulator RpfG family c-di-GMP phosphodiesterase